MSHREIELSRRVDQLEIRLREKEKNDRALSASEKRYRSLFESSQDGILILDARTGQIVDVNPFLMELLGCSYEALLGQHIWEIGEFKDIAASKEAFKVLQNKKYIRYDNLSLETQTGTIVPVEFVSNAYLVDHKEVIQCNIRDISRRRRAETESQMLRAAIEQTEETIVITDILGIIQYVNPAFERTTGYSSKEALGQNPRILKSGQQDDQFYRSLWETISAGATWTGQMINKRKDGTLYTEESTISPILDPLGRIVKYAAVKRDITDQLLLADRVQQSQKMEAVGLLAGGVAHDFNNMLSVIMGYAEIALEKTDPSSRLRSDLEEILQAAEHSADITRQLLAFARKQTIVPVVLDLNHNIQSVLKMLRRLIGENIDLAWLPEENLWPVEMDPVQVDQILANLCVNARDAIADTGRVSIETRNVFIDDVYCATHQEAVCGEYVKLIVSDNGCGMEKESLDQVFEPFYTSKEPGQGTGLGLATVYGIVKQNRGFINVYSEPGEGTSFKIYFPRCADSADDNLQKKTLNIPQGSGETILLVEDEPSLLKLSRTILEGLGYEVLAAGSPEEALDLASKHEKKIKLLLTDVVMPGINGRELSERLQSLYPKMIILFMSGYTADMIAHRGVLDKGVNFIQKPFSMKDLALKVRDALYKSV